MRETYKFEGKKNALPCIIEKGKNAISYTIEGEINKLSLVVLNFAFLCLFKAIWTLFAILSKPSRNYVLKN